MIFKYLNISFVYNRKKSDYKNKQLFTFKSDLTKFYYSQYYYLILKHLKCF